ncbi:MAG: DedA family protein [Candidatus Omnitrophica bacterium]|nr:DedA family protein [Candidatus Omnitrophota bacterium]
MLKRLYNWVIHWSKSAYALFALFAIAFSESSFFPIPPDALLIAILLGNHRRWVKAATVCMVGSVLGGICGYLIGKVVWDIVNPFFFRYVFSESAFNAVKGLYHRYEFWAVFTAGFTPIPYKVFTIAGGVCRINFFVFVVASVLSRGARFFIVAILLRTFGEKIKVFIEKYFNLITILFTAALVGGFLIIRYLVRH